MFKNPYKIVRYKTKRADNPVNQGEFAALMDLIVSFFPKFKLSCDQIDHWYRILKEFHRDEIRRAVYDYAITEKFAPSLADLRKHSIQARAKFKNEREVKPIVEKTVFSTEKNCFGEREHYNSQLHAERTRVINARYLKKAKEALKIKDKKEKREKIKEICEGRLAEWRADPTYVSAEVVEGWVKSKNLQKLAEYDILNVEHGDAPEWNDFEPSFWHKFDEGFEEAEVIVKEPEYYQRSLFDLEDIPF